MSLVHEQMVKVMKAVTPIAKESSKGVKYKFRSIDQLFDAVHGIFAEHGLFLSPRVLDDWSVNAIPGTPDHKGNERTQFQATFRLCIDVYAEDGSCVTLGPGLAQSHDYGDKSVYQGQQNSFKYVLIEALTIPTGEQDMDGRQPDEVPAQRSGNGQTSDRISQVRTVQQRTGKSDQDIVRAVASVTGGDDKGVLDLDDDEFSALLKELEGAA